MDDEYGRRIAAEIDCVTFAIEREADYRAREIEFDLMGSRFTLRHPRRGAADRVAACRAYST